MSNSIEEEFQHMDEIEFREQKEIEKAISVDDPISTLNTNNIILVSKGTTIQEVIEKFQQKKVACVLIGDEFLEGIFTERDVIIKLAGRGLDYRKEIIENHMTYFPESLRNSDSIAFALNRMTEGGYRHIPIVNSRGKPVGLIGILDIVSHLAEYFSQDVLNLPPLPIRKQKQAEGC